MIDHRHYIPILKTKLGERKALATLAETNKASLTPVFEIHPPAKKKGLPEVPMGIHVAKVVQGLAEDWGTEADCFLDGCWIRSPYDGGEPIRQAFIRARETGLRAIPVARIDDGESPLQVLRTIASEDGRGCLLRVKAESVTSPFVRALPGVLGLSPQSVDLLIECRAAVDVTRLVGRVPDVDAWRSLIVAIGVFPPSLAGLETGRWHSIPRGCWTAWSAAVQQQKALRLPAFADYATRDSGRPPAGGQARAAIRYATPKSWYVRQDGKVTEGKATDMVDICRSLRSQNYFSGESFSDGDRMICQVARRDESSVNKMTVGNAGQWVQWGINHHITLVCDQIRRLTGP